MAGPTMDPAGLSHAVVLRALEEECGVPVPAKLNEGQEGTIHNSRGVCETPWLRRFRMLFPIGECIAIQSPAAGRGMTRCVDGEPWLLNVQCMAQESIRRTSDE